MSSASPVMGVRDAALSVLLFVALAVSLTLAIPPDIHRAVNRAFLRMTGVVGMAAALSVALAFNVRPEVRTSLRYPARLVIYLMPALVGLSYSAVIIAVGHGYSVTSGPLLILGALFLSTFLFQHVVVLFAVSDELYRWRAADGGAELLLRTSLLVISVVPLVALWVSIVGPAVLYPDR